MPPLPGDRPFALVVEDDPDLREAFCCLLQQDGYDTTATTDVDSALTELVNAVFDVVVLDLGLPQRSGDELLAEMAERGMVVPVLIVSASPEAHGVGGRYGVSVVEKPFDADVLLATIAKVRKMRVVPRAPG